MSTRANIKFRNERGEVIHVYRHSDGFPDVIEPDIDKAISVCSGRWSGSEIGIFVSLFLAMHYSDWEKKRLPDYELTTGVHGDEDYLYTVEYDQEQKQWVRRETQKQY